jgi:hypothetical protein
MIQSSNKSFKKLEAEWWRGRGSQLMGMSSGHAESAPVNVVKFMVKLRRWGDKPGAHPPFGSSLE